MKSLKILLLFLALLYCKSHLLAEEKQLQSNEKTKGLRWLSKTDQFVIYQERKIKKSKSGFVTVSMGKHQLNGVSSNNELIVDYTLYNSETSGFGAYGGYSISSIEADIEIRDDSEYIFHNKSKYQIGLFYDWVPFYGKHLYDQSTVYTDMGVRFFLGYSAAENNNKVIEEIDNSKAFESTSSFDGGISFFYRFFFQDKYFFKLGYKIRNTALQEANKPGQASPGSARTFVNNLEVGFGIKL